MAETNVSEDYLREIQKRYAELDPSKLKNETSGVEVDDVLRIPEVRSNKLASLIAEKYGGSNRTLYPRDFVDFFCALSVQRSPLEKVDVLFHVLDVKKLGQLGPIEMYRYYHVLLSPSLSNKQIEDITNNLMNQTGGKIDIDKFRQIMPAWQVAEKMTVELQRNG